MLNHLFDLSGRSVLLTGGSRGLGKAMASAMVHAGADIMIVGRDAATLARAANEMKRTSDGKVEYAAGDLTVRRDLDTIVDSALTSLGKIDILVNNAGSYLGEPLIEINDANWDHLLELNLTSAMRLTRAIAPGMIERKWGRIIHVASILAMASRLGSASYSATKAALVGMTRASALELGPLGVTVNCLAPGAFNTTSPDVTPTPRQKENFAVGTALGRWGQPNELAGPALLLASDAGSYITGSVLVVDGGALCRTLY
jgi:NAD(P)-dependent dehydrogenase (short-subunit alcohol dehydrogenase family)